jgi:hypothetical protein
VDEIVAQTWQAANKVVITLHFPTLPDTIMRHLLLALPFALLPLASAHAASGVDEHVHEHASLGTHEHGVARLDAALDGSVLELQLQSPAMNLVGFEHAASSAADKAQVAAARKILEQPLALLQLDAAARCTVTTQTLESPLFGDQPALATHDDEDGDDDDDHDHAAGEAHEHAHSEIHAVYQLTCAKPDALHSLSLAPLFKAFPATRVVQLQVIAPSGQQGMAATVDNSRVTF